MSVKKIVRIAIMGSLLYIGQVTLNFIPNVEVVTPLILVMTLLLGSEALYAIFVFILLEGIFWGFGIWWLGYLYVWPLLYFIITLTKRFNPSNDFVIWSFVMGFYGLFFGFFFAIAYLVLSFEAALSYWIAGLPFDITHGIANFFVTFIIAKPLYQAIQKSKILK